MLELETINKLFLELSQVATATTKRELELIAEVERLRAENKMLKDEIEAWENAV